MFKIFKSIFTQSGKSITNFYNECPLDLNYWLKKKKKHSIENKQAKPAEINLHIVKINKKMP